MGIGAGKLPRGISFCLRTSNLPEKVQISFMQIEITAKNPWKAAELEFASPRRTFQPIIALKFLPDSSDICLIIQILS